MIFFVIHTYPPLILLTFPGLAAVVSKMSPLGSFVLNLNEIMLCFPVSHGGNICLVIKRKRKKRGSEKSIVLSLFQVLNFDCTASDS